MKHSMPFSECVDDAIFWIDINEYEKSKDGLYARLKLLEQADTESLSLEALKNHGLSAAPQGPIKVDASLHSYIDSHFDDYYTDGLFTDVSKNEQYHEGHVRSVKVDIYERSSIARGKCIEYHGSSCLICGLNFGDKYGCLGEGFIHVHHLRPLHTIQSDYVVDYKKDLIPVCPNCHAMIHRIPNCENMSISEIKTILSGADSFNNTLQSETTETQKTNSEPFASTHQTDKANVIVHSKKVDSIILPNIKTGDVVTHKTFGKGTITNINTEQKNICVSFDIGEKTFLMNAFEKGFLKLV